MSDFYGMDFSIKSFAVANEFVQGTNKSCYMLGTQLMPFSIYNTEEQTKAGVVDFAKFNGCLDETKTLEDEITGIRGSQYRDFGISLDLTNPETKKMLMYDYFLATSICYVEIPKYITKNGVSSPSYDKFLCTRNPAIMGAWMGMSPSEMQAKYSRRIEQSVADWCSSTIRVVKLLHSSKGNSISVPRRAFEVSEIERCIPLYMLYAFVEGFKTVLKDNILEFTYLKDNGTVRKLNSTLSETILRDYYDDNVFIGTMLAGVDINTVKQGGMLLSSKVNRGYIKVPELGASIYDGTGVRSLNIARLLSIKKVSEVDRTFIKVDLNSVIENFNAGVDNIIKTNPSIIYALYDTLTEGTDKHDKYMGNASPAYCGEICKSFVSGRSVILSTEYLRYLHKLMISKPDWFPNYTGSSSGSIVKSSNIGVGFMDF